MQITYRYAQHLAVDSMNTLYGSWDHTAQEKRKMPNLDSTISTWSCPALRELSQGSTSKLSLDDLMTCKSVLGSTEVVADRSVMAYNDRNVSCTKKNGLSSVFIRGHDLMYRILRLESPQVWSRHPPMTMGYHLIRVCRLLIGFCIMKNSLIAR